MLAPSEADVLFFIIVDDNSSFTLSYQLFILKEILLAYIG